MEIEADRLVRIFKERYGLNFGTGFGIRDLVSQFVRAEKQLNEMRTMGNRILTDDYMHVKKEMYKNIVFEISKLEHEFGLKSGFMIGPAMDFIDEMFLSAAYELDLPTKEKIQLFDKARYLNVLVREVKTELQTLKAQPRPHTVDLDMNIKTVEDKLYYLNKQLLLVQIQNKDERRADEIKETLLDGLFEVNVRKHLEIFGFKSEIKNEYVAALTKEYESKKADLLKRQNLDVMDARLIDTMTAYRRAHEADFMTVDNGYWRLHKFNERIPKSKKQVKDYLDGILLELSDSKKLIKDRADFVKHLPHNADFNRILKSVEGGSHFLVKFARFVYRVIASLVESLKTGKSFLTVYRAKKQKETMDRIIRRHGVEPERKSPTNASKVSEPQTEETLNEVVSPPAQASKKIDPEDAPTKEPEGEEPNNEDKPKFGV
jgi:hypothetical protein